MKVCIIGNGLTSLALAKVLVKKDIFVDIFYNQIPKKHTQTRTIGISKSNIEFFDKNISNIKKISWNIKDIKIYTESSIKDEVINFSDSSSYLFSILKNDELYSQLSNELKDNRFFKLKKIKNYKILDKKNYDLIINCDVKSEISKKFFFKKLKKNYNSQAYTTIFNHKKISSNYTAIQIFTKNGPIAFLPISKTKTSVVFSIRNNNRLDETEIIKLIKKFNPKYQIEYISDLSQFEIKSSNLRKYYHENILAFGDLLHKIHPLAGQGFNMSLRDIKVLNELIEKRINLGLVVDNSICYEFQKKTKDKNYIFSKGVDWIYEFFNFESRINNKYFINTVKSFLKNQTFNKFLKKFANTGINAKSIGL